MGRPLGVLPGRVPPPLRAYALDIGGSLAGIAAFFLLSWLEQPPAGGFFGPLLIAPLPAGPTRPHPGHHGLSAGTFGRLPPDIGPDFPRGQRVTDWLSR